MNSYSKPLPKPDVLTAGFWEHAKRHVLAIQACLDCGDEHFPASPVCPACLSERQEWRRTNGRGILESWIEFHRAYWPGFSGDLPYRVCLVRLDAGPLLVSNLVGSDAEIGDAVRVVFETATSEITIPKFQKE
jgi:uncharacterized OB-fold protein